MLTRRQILGALAFTGVGATESSALPSDASLAADVGEMLLLGFTGNTIESESARTLSEHVAAGRVGGAMFRKMNVARRDDVVDLLRIFSPPGTKALNAIDHEGGFVQRLGRPQGFTKLPPPREVALAFSPEQARDLYAIAAKEFADVGFSVNLAPVVDLFDPRSPAIGHFGRAFARQPAVVADYAAAFIDAFAAAGIHCALKHFPGEGLALDDSHDDLPDVTATWSEEELEPYARLIAAGRARLVMTGHMRLTSVEPSGIPTTLSAAVISGLLRSKLGFAGVAMTDDLDMAAISEVADRRQAVIRAINAGNDLLMIGNTSDYDPQVAAARR